MIDLHAHVVLESELGAAGPYGPELDDGDPTSGRLPCFRVGDYELVGVRYRNSPFMDAEARLAAMDDAGIDLQVLSPNPITYFAHVETEIAEAFCRRHNDEVAALVARTPDRLAGFTQLPMQDPDRAAAELRRSVRDLGLLGPYIGTDLGRPLDDAAFDVVWAACVELGVPVFVHPAPDGITTPRRDERLARFDGDLWLGFLYEETLAVAQLVLGGVLDRHPTLDVCVSHGGGATAWLAERLEHAARTRPWAPEALTEPGAVRTRLERLWWDAHVGGKRTLDALISMMGPDRIVAGTNLAGWDQSLDPCHEDPSLATTFDANARRLLRLPPEAGSPRRTRRRG
jgi:aminocarboxymuconate-semialdehyde decarboxylase